MELLDRGTYFLDPVHPPLSRDAVALLLYIAGERFPKFSAGNPRGQNYNEVGNAILYSDGHHFRNLSLARIPILAFLIVEAFLVFFWTRELYGNFAAVIAVGLFTSLPIVLAFSGLDYSDIPTSCTQLGAIFAFTQWLKNPNWRSTLILGLCSALAFLTKMTSFIFLPAAALMIILSKIAVDRHGRGVVGPTAHTQKWLLKSLVIVGVIVVVFWSGYGFSVGHVQQSLHLSPDNMPSFQHFPKVVGSVARRAIISNWVIPVPAFLDGMTKTWVLNKQAPPAYLLGHIKSGGWWYFFLVALAVKTPLPFLILCAIGISAVWRQAWAGNWEAAAPLAAAVAILLVTMPVKYDAGLRHILVVLPLLAAVGGYGASVLWNSRRGRRYLPQLILIGLLVWQGISSFRARADYISYFNEIAANNPSKFLLTGCDLDCGQDLSRLADYFSARNIKHVSVAMWSSADLSKSGLPEFEVLQPFTPVSGWIAISARSQIFGDVFHSTYPPGAFAWLDRYQPVANVGKTIRLYYIK